MIRNEDRRPAPGKPAQSRCVNVYIDGYNFYVPLAADGSERLYELTWCDFLRLSEGLLRDLAARHPHEFSGCELGIIKYFTATIPEGMPSDPGGIQRKHAWLEALHYRSGGRVEIVHGTFRPRKHRFYIEGSELAELARGGVPINWDQANEESRTYGCQMRVHEEKQTDVMLAASLVADAALAAAGRLHRSSAQQPPLHLTNRRPSPSACHAAVVISADIDILPAAEIAAAQFHCPVAIGFSYPHPGYRLCDAQPQPVNGVFTFEIGEQALRECRLPPVVETEPGAKVSFDQCKRGHFERARRMARI